MAGWWRTQPFLIALLTSTAVPLVPNGQEFGEEYVLPEDDKGTVRRIRSRALRRELRQDSIGRPLTALHTRLANLRNEHPALRSPYIYPADWDTGKTEIPQASALTSTVSW